jgi:hypothetical protein
MMADDADRAQEQIEAELVHARSAAQTKLKLLPIGRCYNCDEALRGRQLFCDQECAEDFEKRERAHAFRGD